MSQLPSFVELLDSLDLEEEDNSEVQHYAHYPVSPSFVASSPSYSLPPSQASREFLSNTESATHPSNISHSPSIVISRSSPVTGDFATSRRRSVSNRYNPYDYSNHFTRRRSLPGDLSSYPTHSYQSPDPFRAYSASPPTSSRRASLGHSDDQTMNLSTTRTAKPKADQPISAFVRRRHPYTFPAPSPEYRKPTRSVSPTDALVPVSLPSLPPLPRISTGIDTHIPSSSVALRLPSISVLDHNWISTSVYDDPRSRVMSRTPTPPSYNVYVHQNNIVGHSPPH